MSKAIEQANTIEEFAAMADDEDRQMVLAFFNLLVTMQLEKKGDTNNLDQIAASFTKTKIEPIKRAEFTQTLECLVRLGALMRLPGDSDNFKGGPKYNR